MTTFDVKLRREEDSDLPFLRSLFASTRVDVTFSHLPEEQKAHFIKMQFDAQRRHYKTYYQNAEFNIIQQNRRRIGRFYVCRMPDQIRVMEVTLIPEARRKGIGSRLIRMVQEEAKGVGMPVTLHAEKLGTEVEFYQRLGFEIVEVKESHFFMKWVAGASIFIT